MHNININNNNQIPLIKLLNASLIYGDKTVLNKINWELKPAEHWAVVGPNGAGKTSFLRLLRGEVRPTIDYSKDLITPPCLWGFTDEADSSPLAIRPISSMLTAEQQRYYVRQGWQLTGEDIILSGLGDGVMLYDKPSLEEKETVYLLAEKLGALHLLDALATNLSQGQLRLVLLGKALIKKPRLLLLDEPCDGLDAKSRKIFFQAVNEAVADGASIVCAIHRDDELPDCVTHVLELNEGNMTHSGTLEEHHRTLQKNIFQGGDDTKSSITLRCHSGESIFCMHNADVYLNRKKILKNIKWEVKQGEQWLLSGPNGSGKSTLLKVLLGEEHVALGGYLRWFGLEGNVTLEERRRYTGYVSDWLRNQYLYNLNGREMVISGLHGSIGLYRDSTPKELEAADYWIRLFNLTQLTEQLLDDMSEGTARRFLLARAIAPRPKLLILDEPCSGLDAGARSSLLEHIPQAIEQGVSVIFVSHSPGDLRQIGDIFTHELQLEDGQIKYSGPKQNEHC